MDISESLTEDIEKKLTDAERKILDKFYKELSINAGEGKIKQYRAFILQFRDTINKPLQKVNRDDLIQFWNLLKSSSYKWNSQCMKRKYIKRFIRFQFGEIKAIEMLKGLTAGEFKPSERYTKEGNLKVEELERMMRAATSLRDKAMLALLYESAARPEELLKLTWKNLKKEEVNIFSSKTKRERTIPLKECLIHLQRWKQEWQFPDIKDNDLIFPAQSRDRILTTAALNRVIEKIAKRAGIKRDLTAYTFRHSRLTEIWNKGVQGFDHNLFAGHKKGSKQTATYVKTDEEEMKKAMLEKVFHVEELSPEEKNELHKEIANLKKQNQIMKNGLAETKEMIKEYLTAKGIKLP